ncbi:MAG TPA: hypothetical protein LFW20_01190 [Rickettsia endosymbiont of Omalisus fontisbellaquei]|nr:hypothetical protein [Rickettsia endosymbiont of Omalisus fontisbellaquei]
MKNIKHEDNNLYKVCKIKEKYNGSNTTLIELKCIGARGSFFCLSEDLKFFKNKLPKEDIKFLRKLKLIK